MNRGKPWVGGLVALCLAAVLYLLVTAPAEADLVSVVHTTLEDFNAGILYHTGLARFDDGEVQLLVVGLAGTWITDTNTTGLPPLDGHTAVHHDGRIFVLGGENKDLEPTRGVYSTTILADHDLADWQPANPLPESIYPNGLELHASVVVSDWLYVIGGDDESTQFDAVTFAPIGPGGRLGTWQSTASLPTPLYMLQAVVVSDTIYVIGGKDDQDDKRNEVYFAHPDGTGEIAAWTQTTDFAYITYGHMAAASGGRIYVLGGYHKDLAPNYVSPYVHYADLDPDTGQVTSWSKSIIDMPNNYYAAAALSYAGQLYMTGGGRNSVTNISNDVGSTLIAEDGSIGPWYDTDVIDPARFFHAAVCSDHGWLYIINGSDGLAPIEPSSINRGATSGAGELYAPDGTFTSQIVDMNEARRLVELNWNTTITDTSLMTITMYFRTKKSTVAPWSDWYGPYPSSSTPGTVTTTLSLASMPSKARFFQYEAHLATDDTSMTPFLNTVEVIYNIPVPDFEIDKDSMPSPGSMVGLSETIYYTLTYINDVWSITATQATIEDAPPQYTRYRPGSIWGPGADDSDPSMLRWDLGELLPGDTDTVGYAVIVSPTLGYEAILRNTATLVPQPYGTKISNLVTHTVAVPPLELELTKEAVPPPGTIVLPGAFITYTISYTNAGDVYAHQVLLTDTYDLNRSYGILSIDPPPVLSPGEGRDVWQLGLLGPDQRGQITVAVQLTDTLPNHWPVTNRATLDSLYSQQLLSDVVTHTVIFTGVDLVDLVVGGIRWQPVEPGPKTPVVFSAAITNTGTLDADTYFYAELYIRPDPPNPPVAPWDHDQGYCLDDCASPRENYIAHIGTLPKGESTEVVFSGEDVEFDHAGQWHVCVQVDVSFEDSHYNLYWGAYPEDYESNNIACVVVDVEPEWKIYLPRVVRHWP